MATLKANVDSIFSDIYPIYIKEKAITLITNSKNFNESTIIEVEKINI